MNSQEQAIPFEELGVSFLPHGMGRSLGDSCLNDGNALLTTRGLNRIISFDREKGRIVAEAGITFDRILSFSIPQGWFLPVTPGTRFISLGGAVGNDVHGKNHHRAGTFGHHVVRFQLRRSDGTRILCSQRENANWFRATVGGLGLTGLIEWAEVQLMPIANSCMDCETIRFGSLDEFFALSEESIAGYEYIVAWTDTLSRKNPGRGLFFRGNHNTDPARRILRAPDRPAIGIPCVFPVNLVNRATLGVFNNAFYWARPQKRRTIGELVPFFYPLDSIGNYHRIYGPGGMIQWQGLVPSRQAVGAILSASSAVGGSFLTVMKVMGDHARAGMMSFPGKGITIALDFPYSQDVLTALPMLDDIVAEAGGRLYPAKDSRMSRSHFQRYFPQWRDLLPFVDEKFSSSFWRRVTEGEITAA